MKVPGFRFQVAGGGGALSCLPIIVTAAALYANSLRVPFVFDDHREIVNNPAVHTWRPWHEYLTERRGLVQLTYTLNYHFGGTDPRGYHLLNIAIHALNGVLVFALVRTTLRRAVFGGRYARQAPAIALISALAFVAHPIQTQAVTYVTQRTEAIAASFYLLALWCAARAADGRRGALGFSAAAVASSYLAMVSKEMAVTIPGAVLLYDACFAGGLRRLGRRWLLHGALALTALYPLYWQAHVLFPGFVAHPLAGRPLGGPVPIPPAPPPPAVTTAPLPEPRTDLTARWFTPTAGLTVPDRPVLRYLATEFGVVLWYLRLFVLPTRLTFDYAWPLADSFWQIDVILPLIVLLALGGLAVALRRHYPIATFCAGWTFLVLSVTSIVPLLDAAFEYRVYLPVAALAWLTAAAGADLAAWAAPRIGRWGWWAAAGAVLAWAGALGALTVARNRVYQDPLTLHADTVAKAPASARAQYDYGNALMKQRRYAEAMEAFRAALRADPARSDARIHLALLLKRAGRYDEAEAELKAAAAGARELSVAAVAFNQLGLLYDRLGRRTDAIAAHYQSARLQPGAWEPRRNLGFAYLRAGQWEAAAAELAETLRLDATREPALTGVAARAYLEAGRACLERGDLAGASSAFAKAIQHRPTLAAAYHYLAYAQSAAGAWDAAAETLRDAAAAVPGDPLIAENQARVARGELPALPS